MIQILSQLIFQRLTLKSWELPWQSVRWAGACAPDSITTKRTACLKKWLSVYWQSDIEKKCLIYGWH